MLLRHWNRKLYQNIVLPKGHLCEVGFGATNQYLIESKHTADNIPFVVTITRIILFLLGLCVPFVNFKLIKLDLYIINSMYLSLKLINVLQLHLMNTTMHSNPTQKILFHYLHFDGRM